jgi:hypothetical protein
LNDDLTPQLNSLIGNALAQVLTADVDPEKLPLLSRLDQQLEFIDLDNIDLSKLKTRLSFNDGKVQIEPFDFDVKGINVRVAGGHGFDMSMDYNLNLDIPARLLGSQVGNALSQLSGDEIRNMNVALPVGLRGTFQNPQININMEQAVSQLTNKIVEKQKANLRQRGEEAIRDVISGRTGQNRQEQTQTDTTARDTTNAQTPPVSQQPKNQEEQVKEAARNILGGMLKKNQTKKDTVQ